MAILSPSALYLLAPALQTKTALHNLDLHLPSDTTNPAWALFLSAVLSSSSSPSRSSSTETQSHCHDTRIDALREEGMGAASSAKKPSGNESSTECRESPTGTLLSSLMLDLSYKLGVHTTEGTYCNQDLFDHRDAYHSLATMRRS